jgi:hypothetical protein
MHQYKYRALVKLGQSADDSRDPDIAETGGRVVVRAHHHETHRSKIFPALINGTPGQPPLAAEHRTQLTMTVVGDDARDYLEPGDTFVLWRGHDIGQGVISRRLFFWADSP